MSTWVEANQVANLAAAQAHADLEIDPAGFPIDVYSAIEKAGVLLMWRPLPKAFGIYVDAPGSRPGILINNRLGLAVQRHTAAHELGHHMLGHGSRVDVDLDPFSGPRRGWSDSEKVAEAFAVWFLMPRRAVRAALEQMSLERLHEPEEVYQLSLLLGTSFRATVRHLRNLRLAGQHQVRAWMAVQPSRIKNRIDPGVPPASRLPNVWKIDRSYNSIIVNVAAGDRLVVDTEGLALAVSPSGGAIVVPSAPGRRGRSGESARTVVVEFSQPTSGPISVEIGGPNEGGGWSFDAVLDRPNRGVYGVRDSGGVDSAEAGIPEEKGSLT